MESELQSDAMKAQRQARFTEMSSRQKVLMIGLFLIPQRLEELKESDKLERQQFVRKTMDLSEAQPIVGTCLDMCPEKERYEREEWKDLSVFEMVWFGIQSSLLQVPGTEHDKIPRVDHQRAVKKFSRPSVKLDNVEILPKEVRPPPVLKKTLDYLINEILDRTDYPFHEVHNFIRDRTRSIRQVIRKERGSFLSGLHISARAW